MKLKYYLRGLGIGIVVTAIIMMAALGNKQPMTDEEVVARAKELGMIENTVLTDIGTKEQETEDKYQQVSEEQSKDTESENLSELEDNTEDNADMEEVPSTDTDNDTEEQKETDTEEKPNTAIKDVVSITVVGGDSSWTVAKRMEEAGLIDSAKDFDAHLCRYGYDKKISVGTYDIPTTATHEEMAKILTKSE